MYDNEIKDKFVELRAAGKSFGDISQELGVVKSTLHRWEDERADDIARLRRIEWEEQEHRWGRNIEEVMTDLACSISDYEMRLRHFTDNLSNLSLRDTVMLLRESRREYFRLRAMLMGTAPRPRPPKPAASVTPDPRAEPRCETKPNSRGLTRPDPLDSTNPQPANAVHNPPSDPSVEPPSETKSNETERFQQNGTVQHRNTNDLQQ